MVAFLQRVSDSALKRFDELRGLLTAGTIAVVVVAVGAFINPVAARAADDGRLLMGYDYEMFVVEDGGGAKSCERACGRDRRCMSWSFVKRIEQCRLKYDVGNDMANACCISGVKGEKAAETDDDEASCSRAAIELVRQQEINLQYQCGLTGSSWSTDFRANYDRCLDQSPKKRASERAAMKAAVDECRTLAAREQDGVCDHYARVSLEQFKTNDGADCGFAGDEWGGSQRDLTRWCSRETPNSAQSRQDQREKLIGRCLSRGGGKTDETCEVYAKLSVSQYKKSADLKCGEDFQGPYWNADFRQHYRWCLKNRDRVDRVSKERRRALETCDRADGGGLKFIFKF